MNGVIGFAIVAMVVVVVIAIAVSVHQRQAREERARELAEICSRRGWTFTAEDDRYANRWQGEPFASKRGRVRHVVTGEHNSRPFTAFEYWYTTSTYNGTTSTTQTHTFTVWAIELPGTVPELSVGPEGAFGGKVAEAFGFARVDIDDQAFNDTFKVKSDDERFTRLVLSPEVVDLLKRTGPWKWRFTGNTMLSWEATQLDPAALEPRIDLMLGVVAAVPGQVWEGPR